MIMRNEGMIRRSTTCSCLNIFQFFWHVVFRVLGFEMLLVGLGVRHHGPADHAGGQLGRGGLQVVCLAVALLLLQLGSLFSCFLLRLNLLLSAGHDRFYLSEKEV
eukprot:TRINITY_DN37491_c0_g1_i1.p1 TRINITY_DN37491_c0_g1~~TRINITY_DN37491_c0_g1_i1.p1  ORF type:complete len:105 (+),score=18.03 TRINITY_DN37491_c0_g1_i1:80-394(+)